MKKTPLQFYLKHYLDLTLPINKGSRISDLQFNLSKVCTPYCLDKIGSDKYIILNRFYKPLGWPSQDWVDYQSIECAASWVTANECNLSVLPARENIPALFFYDDSCTPRSNFENRMKYRALIFKVFFAEEAL